MRVPKLSIVSAKPRPMPDAAEIEDNGQRAYGAGQFKRAHSLFVLAANRWESCAQTDAENRTEWLRRAANCWHLAAGSADRIGDALVMLTDRERSH